MTFKQFLLTMLAATAVVWLAWLFILFNIDPMTSSWVSFLFFYFTLGVSLTGTMTVIGTAVRRRFRPSDLVSRQVLASFRQSVWLSIILIVALILLSQGVFHLWIITLVIFVFALVELAFLSARRRPSGMIG
ncbi:MAG: hypothetical protein WC702_00630 [Patescibacteria group bacterium]|jgi:hypothetical protein